MTETFSTGKKIIKASIIITLAHAAFKLVGLFQLKIMAHFLSAKVIEAVYITAFEGCVFALFLMGEEIVGPAFLPVFMGEKEKKGESAAWRFASIVLSIQFLILLVVSALVMLYPSKVISLLTVWSPEFQPEKYKLASDSLVWSAPALICLSLGSTTYMILNGYKRFFLAAFGDAASKFIVALAILFGAFVYGADHRMLVLGLVAGSVVKVATHLLGMLKEIRFFRPSFNLKNPAFISATALMLPLLCGIIFGKIRDVFNNVWVLSRLDVDGLMQANLYGRKLYGFIGWLIPYALSIAIFPFLCEMAGRGDRKEFTRLLKQSVRMLVSLFVPLSIVCLVLAAPLTNLMFSGGKFSPQIASWTALSTACYTLILPAAAVEALVMQAFFAQRRMVLVTAAGIFFSSFSIAVSGLGIVFFGLRDAGALMAIALGFVGSRILKSFTLIFLIKKDVESDFYDGAVTFLVRAFVVGVASAFVSWGFVAGVNKYIFSENMLFMSALELTFGSVGAVLGFVAAVKITRLEEPMVMVGWLVDRIKSKFKR